jgi:uncharacterized protein (DUF2147 family)
MVRFAAAVLLLLCPSLAAAQAETPPLGLWSTPDLEGVVQIASCKGNFLCGTIIGVTPAPGGAMPHDIAGEPQCRLILLNDLRPQADGRWHGTVRNPEDGHVYNAEVWLGPDGQMRLRGFIGIELFGQTQTWPKFTGTVEPDCHFHLAGHS